MREELARAVEARQTVQQEAECAGSVGGRLMCTDRVTPAPSVPPLSWGAEAGEWTGMMMMCV
eukprot:COSAG01_NODE_10253_length_2209_cov_2.851659_5_plen_62_part_00